MAGKWELMRYKDSVFLSGADVNTSGEVINQAEKLLGHKLDSYNVNVIKMNTVKNFNATYYAIYPDNADMREDLSAWANSHNNDYYNYQVCKEINDKLHSINMRYNHRGNAGLVASFISFLVMLLLVVAVSSVNVIVAFLFIAVISMIFTLYNNSKINVFNNARFSYAIDSDGNIVKIYFLHRNEKNKKRKTRKLNKLLNKIVNVNVEEYDGNLDKSVVFTTIDNNADVDKNELLPVDEVVEHFDNVYSNDNESITLKTVDKFADSQVITESDDALDDKSIASLRALAKSIGELENQNLNSDNINKSVNKQIDDYIYLNSNGNMNKNAYKSLVSKLDAVKSRLESIGNNDNNIDTAISDLDAVIEFKHSKATLK